MSESVSLAVLENLVHLPKADFPAGFVVVQAVVPSGVLVLRTEGMKLIHPILGVVHAGTPTAGYRQLGDQWLNSGASAVLQVRSSVVPMDYNYLLNPLHPDFANILVERPVAFDFDERLFTRG